MTHSVSDPSMRCGQCEVERRVTVEAQIRPGPGACQRRTKMRRAEENEMAQPLGPRVPGERCSAGRRDQGFLGIRGARRPSKASTLTPTRRVTPRTDL